MYVFDQFGQFKNWNRNFEMITGYARKDILNMNPLDFIAIENKSIVQETITTIFETGYGSVEAGFSNQSGETVPYLFTGFKYTQEDVDFLIGVGIDISERVKVEQEKAKLIKKLEETLSELKTLSGLLPICASCKKIRDDKGYWNQIDSYIQEHSDATFSHSMCPQCSDKLYGDKDWYIDMKKDKGIE
ncbi:MAG: PAS domain S-box protein [Desulfobacula sp.]|nr:PAS domain S-box protein [Desulfobacula sp.]